MNERHTNQNSCQNDFETGQPVQSHLCSEAHLLLAGTSSCPQSVRDVEHRNLLDYRDGTAGYSMTQYAEPHSLEHRELAVPSIPAVTEYRGNGPLPVAQVHGRNRAVVAGFHRFSARTHSYNHPAQGNFMGQPFQPPSGMWINQQCINNGVGGGALPWNVIPIIPCFPGSNIHGASFETAIVHPHGYHEAAGHRGHRSFLHSAPMINQPHNLHPLPCIQGIGGFPATYHPLAAGTPGGHPLNSVIQHRTSLSLSSIDVEGLPPTSGFRMNHPNGRGGLPDAVLRHRNVPYLNILPADEVAVLEIPSVYEARNAIDHHNDMRLDIDDMSYEELLALGEQIGNVNTGLSERAIAEHLKTRLHNSFSASINLQEMPSVDQKVDFCIICQNEFEEERIGSLDCGHEFHEECLKKWLYLKNVCPICKSTALAMQQKDG